MAMGKRKRGKKDTTELSQAEIWDDSALIQSWEEAVEEYQFYHSIQARGENVDDVLREAEAAEAETSDAGVEDGAAVEVEGEVAQPQQHEAQLPTKEDATLKYQDGAAAGTYRQEHPKPATTAAESNANAAGGPSNVPQAVLGGANASGRDEGMKNLMMAWYFAGYYTGLYEGQQMANQQ